MESRRLRRGMKTIGLVALALIATAAVARDGDWEPIQGADTLREFMSGLEAERKNAKHRTLNAEQE